MAPPLLNPYEEEQQGESSRDISSSNIQLSPAFIPRLTDLRLSNQYSDHLSYPWNCGEAEREHVGSESRYRGEFSPNLSREDFKDFWC